MKKALLITFSLGALVCAGFAQQKDCCASGAKAARAKMECSTDAQKCAEKMAKGGCSKMPSAEEQFMAEAKKMEMQAEKLVKKDDCCQSTEAKQVAKGGEGCCNAKDEPAKFKVFVAGVGYKYFGCEESAAKGRKELLAKHGRVGQVQKVSSKVTMS